MSPSPSPSPPPQELTEEELELLEMAERMRTPEPEEELPLPQNILPGLDNGVMNGNSTSPESAPCPRSNELVSARRFAARHKLHPYQREAVEEFVKDTIVGQQIKLFIKQCELGNKLDGLLMVAPPFSVSKPLMDNIKSYGLAVLLSPKLSAYKHAGVPVSHVIVRSTE
ncbi:hypothetical protein H0H81_002048 [Sphagnurus paluster]|uniref:Uncharacterized protein n=1 Tax=Sphagnurus paluster TaxID=117069 RepID=A0A9P7KHI3_9AGAR|nr:hypothetical protein H0H81_002048 [Sphagnurus paluster]